MRRLPRIGVIAIAIAIAAFLGTVAVAPEPARNAVGFLLARGRGGYTVAERLDQYGPAVERRLRGAFARQGLDWPPRELAFLAFKDERLLEVHGRNAAGQPWTFVRSYPILAASWIAAIDAHFGRTDGGAGISRAAISARLEMRSMLRASSIFSDQMAGHLSVAHHPSTRTDMPAIGGHVLT